VKGNRGKALQRKRSEFPERSFAHVCETGGARRTWLRGLTKISKRYPADEVISYDNPHQSISFFTEFQAMTGKQITHLWIYGEEVQFKATFKIRAEHWRVWSTQMLPEEMPGEWKVEIVDEEGTVLQAHKLNYTPNQATLAEN